MLVADLARRNSFDVVAFASYLKTEYEKQYKSGRFSSDPYNDKIDDSIADEAVRGYRELQSALSDEENRIAEIARAMPITSGHRFEGYRIVRYGGYVSGDEAVSIPMGFFTGAISNDDVNESIKKVRNIAIRELKEAAANIDCNAVIGLDFDYITLDSNGPAGTIEIKIILTANGTAVEIEPE